MEVKYLTPRERAVKLCDIVYHSSMGDGWHPFVVGRAIKIADEVIEVLSGNHIYNAGLIEYWKEVKNEIIKIEKNGST